MQRYSLRTLWSTLTSPAAVALIGLGAATGCEPMARSETPVNCDAAELGIERDVVADQYYPFELGLSPSGNNNKFFCFTDESEGGYPAKAATFPGAGCQIPQVETIDNGVGFCNGTSVDADRHQAAFVIRAGDHGFYGGEVANWEWNAGISPPFVPDGIAFWARSDIDSDKFITIYLNDYHSGAPADTVPGTTYSPTLADQGLAAGCVPTASSAASQIGVTVTIVSSDPNVQTSTSSLPLVNLPDQCGNRWRRLLQTSENWQLYLLPFDTFYQDAQPNRAPAIDPTRFYSLSFGFGRGMNVSLWVDEVFFYRNKPAAPSP